MDILKSVAFQLVNIFICLFGLFFLIIFNINNWENIHTVLFVLLIGDIFIVGGYILIKVIFSKGN